MYFAPGTFGSNTACLVVRQDTTPRINSSAPAVNISRRRPATTPLIPRNMQFMIIFQLW